MTVVGCATLMTGCGVTYAKLGSAQDRAALTSLEVHRFKAAGIDVDLPVHPEVDGDVGIVTAYAGEGVYTAVYRRAGAKWTYVAMKEDFPEPCLFAVAGATPDEADRLTAALIADRPDQLEHDPVRCKTRKSWASVN